MPKDLKQFVKRFENIWNNFERALCQFTSNGFFLFIKLHVDIKQNFSYKYQYEILYNMYKTKFLTVLLLFSENTQSTNFKTKKNLVSSNSV